MATGLEVVEQRRFRQLWKLARAVIWGHRSVMPGLPSTCLIPWGLHDLADLSLGRRGFWSPGGDW